MPFPFALGDFRRWTPPFSTPQRDILDWLADAHARAEARWPGVREDFDVDEFRRRIRRALDRFGCSPERIRARGHVLPDFAHADRSRMTVFHPSQPPTGAGLTERNEFYAAAAERALSELFRNAETPPHHLYHVSCTGYVAPSAAQKLVERRGWQAQTTVSHVYHMGCYAAFPAVRHALGALALSNEPNRRVDIVHTELCTLHLNPADHAPEQLVIQTLFADGFIRYSVKPTADFVERKTPFFEILAIHEEIVPDSLDAMTWVCSDWGMKMTLAREVPARIAECLPGFLERLADRAGLSKSEMDRAAYAIHPGGPKIIESVQNLLNLDDERVAASRAVLFNHGNMSSATLPHVWERLLDDPTVEKGTPVVSLAFGPGLTMCGNVLRRG